MSLQADMARGTLPGPGSLALMSPDRRVCHQPGTTGLAPPAATAPCSSASPKLGQCPHGDGVSPVVVFWGVALVSGWECPL